MYSSVEVLMIMQISKEQWYKKQNNFKQLEPEHRRIGSDHSNVNSNWLIFSYFRTVVNKVLNKIMANKLET